MKFNEFIKKYHNPKTAHEYVEAIYGGMRFNRPTYIDGTLATEIQKLLIADKRFNHEHFGDNRAFVVNMHAETPFIVLVAPDEKNQRKLPFIQTLYPGE